MLILELGPYHVEGPIYEGMSRSGTRVNLLNALNAKIRQVHDRRLFESSVLQSFQKESCTDGELALLTKQFNELGLPLEALKQVRRKAYAYAAGYISAKGYSTHEDQARLNRIQQFFVIPDAAIRIPKGQVDRLTLVTQIRNGILPSASVPNLVLSIDETAYWSEPGTIFEERVVNRRYAGQSQGLSVRIAKGVTYRVGTQRGHLVSDKAMLPISSGSLVITNKRLVFIGNTTSFSLRLDKILQTRFTSHGLQCTEYNGKSHDIRFVNTHNVDIVAAVLSRAINNFSI